MNLLTLLLFVLAACLFSAAIEWLVSEKWGFVDWYQERRPKWLPEWCDRCAWFWASFLFALVFAITQQYEFDYVLTVAFLSLGVRVITD